MLRITTRHTSNINGRAQVIAKASGKQRTISWDHAATRDQNHAQAAFTLVSECFADEAENITGRQADWKHTDNGDSHNWEV